jgi:IS4 transposase
MLDGEISHDKITRFISGREYTSKDLWKEVKSTVRQIEREDGCLIFDDTIQEKAWTDENEVMCWHCDHCQGRMVKGVNILNALYYSSEVSIPVAFEVVRKPIQFCDIKTRKTKRASLVTIVRRVFTNKDGSIFLLNLVCSDLTCNGEHVATLYQKRWKVEEFHKSLKSNASLAKSPTRTVTTQNNPIFMSIYAVFKLECLKIKHKTNHFALRTKLFIKATQQAFAALQGLKAA